MKIGFNMLLWTAHVTEEHFPLFETLRKAGYDGVEIPMHKGDAAHFEKVGRAIRDNGLGCTVTTVVPDEEHNPISAEAKHREGAVDYLKWAVECAGAAGCTVLGGPLFQPLAAFTGEGPTEEEKQRAVEVHRRAADFAAEADLTLAVENLNRFECHFLTTLADSAAHAARVDRPNFGVLFDTFHANIEEKDPVGCIGRHIGAIRHVHVSENDRGTPGKGHIDWPGTFRALKEGGYDGWLVIEAFGRALPDVAAATRVWRDFFPSREEVYTEGLRLIREQWEAAG